jgi:hypothetical protein
VAALNLEANSSPGNEGALRLAFEGEQSRRAHTYESRAGDLTQRRRAAFAEQCRFEVALDTAEQIAAGIPVAVEPPTPTQSVIR